MTVATIAVGVRAVMSVMVQHDVHDDRMARNKRFAVSDSRFHQRPTSQIISDKGDLPISIERGTHPAPCDTYGTHW